MKSPLRLESVCRMRGQIWTGQRREILEKFLNISIKNIIYEKFLLNLRCKFSKSFAFFEKLHLLKMPFFAPISDKQAFLL